MAARSGGRSRITSSGLRVCQICGCERYEDEAATCYCQDCRDICRRISTGKAESEPEPDDLVLEAYAERHAQLLAVTARIAAELEAGAA